MSTNVSNIERFKTISITAESAVKNSAAKSSDESIGSGALTTPIDVDFTSLKNTLSENQTDRFRITPTTAAEIDERALLIRG